jgi:Flp pilus assembly protein TadG
MPSRNGGPGGRGSARELLKRRSERGSAALEFAMVLPILLVVALGLVQAGLYVRDQLVLVEAARAGAREASVNPDDGAVRGAVDRAAATLSAEAVSVEVDRTGQQGQPVSVHVTYADPVVIPVVGWLFPPSVDLRADATMRQEYR